MGDKHFYSLVVDEKKNEWVSFFAVLGFELRAYTLSHSTSPPFFCDGFFEIGSCKPFAWAGFAPRSS
jgi:hypothetical protein